MALEHLKLLDPDATGFTFQTFDDNQDRRDPSLARIYHGSLSAHWDELCVLNRKGAGIFLTVNETDLKGRKKQNIIRVRAIWIEDDGGKHKELPIPPHFQIESSPGKYHKYFLVKNANLDEFEGVQKRMTDYGSDPAACDISRVLRLAGFFHQKANKKKELTAKKFKVHIADQTKSKPITMARIAELFPPHQPVTTTLEQDDDFEKAIDDQTIEHLRMAIHFLGSVKLANGKAPAEDYDFWISVLSALKTLPNKTGGKLAVIFSKQCPEKYNIEDLKKVWKGLGSDRTGYQSIFAKAQDLGWANPAKKGTDSSLATGTGFELVPISKILQDTTRPDWLVKKYLERGSMITLIGAPGTYKTFLAISWGLCMAAGCDWLGQKVANKQSVVFVVGEGLRGLRRRFKAFSIHSRIPLDDLAVFVSDRAASLQDDHQVVINSIEPHVKPDFLIFDTLSRNAGSADENSQSDMSKIVANIDRIKSHFDCCVVLVHHTPLSSKNRARGSSVLSGANDFEYLLKKVSSSILLTCIKCKDHEAPKPKILTTRPVELGELDDEGKALSSLVLEEFDQEFNSVGLGKNQRLVLDTITEIYSEKLKDEKLGCATHKITRSELSKKLGLNPQRLSEALRGLLDRGLIDNRGGYSLTHFPESVDEFHPDQL